MSEDYRQELLSVFTESLISDFDSDQIRVISHKLVKALGDYDVLRRCFDVVPYENENERILKHYLACLTVDGKSQGTIQSYKRAIVDFVNVVQKNFKEIGVYDVRYYLAYKKDRGVSNRSLENYRANLSAFFQWMTAEEIIKQNPCLRIKPIKYPIEVRFAFSSPEIDCLRSACHDEKQRAIIEVLLSSGVRVEELISLEVKDVDFSSLSLHVRNAKGGKERIAYINEVAAMHLKEYLKNRNIDGPYLFYNKNKTQYGTSGIRWLVRKIGHDAGIENVHPHRFRRTFATNLANRGMSVQEIQKLMGHSNVNTTLEYVCVDSERVRASYNQYTS